MAERFRERGIIFLNLRAAVGCPNSKMLDAASETKTFSFPVSFDDMFYPEFRSGSVMPSEKIFHRDELFGTSGPFTRIGRHF